MDTVRRPLTWSAHSAATHDEHVHDKKTGQYEPTGQVTATVALQITVRAFDLLDALGSHLSAHEALRVQEVTWHVDWDNPGWRDVRAAAIEAAMAKGRDYAARSAVDSAPLSTSPIPGSSAAKSSTGPEQAAGRSGSPAAAASLPTRRPWTRFRKS